MCSNDIHSSTVDVAVVVVVIVFVFVIHFVNDIFLFSYFNYFLLGRRGQVRKRKLQMYMSPSFF